MKTLEEIRTGIWLYTPAGKVRPDERDWKRIIDMIEINGWVIMPREPTPTMLDAMTIVVDDCDTMKTAYAAMIEARPRHDAPQPRDRKGFGQGGFDT